MNSDKHYCQISGCHRHAAKVIELDLPDAWERTQNYRTLTVVAGFCRDHGHEVERRAAAVLEARSDLYNLVTIVEAAVLTERARGAA